MSQYEKIKLENAGLSSKNALKVNQARRFGDSGFGTEYYSPKIKFIIDILSKSRKKTVIYSQWVGAGICKAEEKLVQKFPTVDINIISGKISGQNRNKIVKNFNKDDKFKILLLSSSAKEGLDLKGVRYFILLEPSWNDASDHQAISRAIRYRSHAHLPEKEQTVEVFRLILPGSVDELLLDHYVKTKKDKMDQLRVLLSDYSI